MLVVGYYVTGVVRQLLKEVRLGHSIHTLLVRTFGLKYTENRRRLVVKESNPWGPVLMGNAPEDQSSHKGGLYLQLGRLLDLLCRTLQ